MKKYNDILADERPEFKATNYGFDTLSNTELLSMVINRGGRNRRKPKTGKAVDEHRRRQSE